MKNEKEKQKIKTLIESIVQEEVTKLNEGPVTEEPFLAGFIEPFADVFRVAKSELTKVVYTSYKSLSKSVKQLALLFLPFVGTAAIHNVEKEAKEAIEKKINSVNQDHREVYERVWHALKNPDVLGFTFLLDPVLPLTKNFALAVKLAKDAPKPLLGALEAITGGHPKVVNFAKKYRQALKVPSFAPDTYGAGGGASPGAGGGFGAFLGDMGGGDMGGGESIEYDTSLLEQQAQQPLTSKSNKKAKFQQKQDPAKLLATGIQKLLQDPEIQRAIKNSPVVKDFQEAGVNAVINTINPVMKANSFEDMKKVLPNFEKIQQGLDKKIAEEQIPPEDLENFKQDFIEQIKEQYKEMILKYLEKQISSEAGIAGQEIYKQIKQKIV